MELTTEDKQRIEQEARKSVFADGQYDGFIAGAEYATIYEREQQLSEFGLEYYKKEANRMGEMYLERNSECVHLKAERSELVKENELLSKAKDELDRIHTNEITQLKIELHTLTEDYDMLEAERSEVRNKVIELEGLLKEILAEQGHQGFIGYILCEKISVVLNSLKTKMT